MKKILLALMVSFVFAMPMAAFAGQGETKLVQLSLFDPVQIFDRDTSVSAFRFNLLYGYNQDVTGLDLGLVNRAAGNVKSLEIGLVNLVGGDFSGVQWGLFNDVKGEFVGWQDGTVNLVGGDFVGLQSGFYNSVAGKSSGLQLGVVNVAGSLYGLQIGLLNFNKAGEPFKFLPIVNFSF